MLNQKKLKSCHFKFDNSTGPKTIQDLEMPHYGQVVFHQIKFKAKIMSKICKNHVEKIAEIAIF